MRVYRVRHSIVERLFFAILNRDLTKIANILNYLKQRDFNVYLLAVGTVISSPLLEQKHKMMILREVDLELFCEYVSQIKFKLEDMG